MKTEENTFKSVAFGTIFFSLFFIACSAVVMFLLPANEEAKISLSKNKKTHVDYSRYMENENFQVPEMVVDYSRKDDAGLSYYRNPETKSAVEWFYTRVVGDRSIAVCILEAADKNDIPLSLAFALAYTESAYVPNAKHVNTNGSIDRGLFQLNNTSFPKLKEIDFFDPATSANYGLAHLSYCMGIAGNEISALAMYNAGQGKVKRNNTPQVTLNYISKIENYRTALDNSFSVEVVALYNPDNQTKLIAKK